MAQITKLAIAGTTLSTIGLGTAYATGLFSGSKPEKLLLINNKTKLVDEGFEVLDTKTTNSDWEKVLAEYHKAQKDTFKEGGKQDQNRKNEDLRAECEKQLNLNTLESYKLTRKWCVKQESISTILNKKSKLLITDKEANTDDAAWKTKITLLIDSDKTTLGNLTIGQQEKTNIDSIKEKCKETMEKKTTDAEFNEKFEVSKKICSIPKAQ